MSDARLTWDSVLPAALPDGTRTCVSLQELYLAFLNALRDGGHLPLRDDDAVSLTDKGEAARSAASWDDADAGLPTAPSDSPVSHTASVKLSDDAVGASDDAVGAGVCPECGAGMRPRHNSPLKFYCSGCENRRSQAVRAANREARRAAKSPGQSPAAPPVVTPPPDSASAAAAARDTYTFVADDVPWRNPEVRGLMLRGLAHRAVQSVGEFTVIRRNVGGGLTFVVGDNFDADTESPVVNGLRIKSRWTALYGEGMASEAWLEGPEWEVTP